MLRLIPLLSTAAAFLVAPKAPATSRLFLEDRIANLIDHELYRQQHKKEYENEWMEKNREAVFRRLNDDIPMEADEETDFRQARKDRRLARTNPQSYCADRCITTGNCDVYEDIFEFSPEQVMEFCSDCVLSEEEEPCEIPDAFYELEDFLNQEH